MEEEIIIPEEETFDCNKLRYILTNDGYLCHASFGGFIVCDLGQCTEYNGEVPDGYETIEEWYDEEIERLNAWKIIDGNLVFDPNRYEILQTKCEKEHEDNRYVCHKEISNLTNIVKSDNANNYLTSISKLSNIVEVTDSNKFASTYIKLLANETLSNKITIKFNNGNLLTNDATSKTESGISFEVNPDRTINIRGTATNDIEYDIGGTPNNTKPILAFKKGVNYYLSSNNHQIRMYNYDGTDREEIYSGNGGVINFTDSDKLVTHIVLYIPSGTKIDETLGLMLNVGSNEKEYVTYQGNEAIVYLGENTFYRGDNIKIENGTPILQNEIYIGDDLIIGDEFIIGGDLIELEEIGMPITYLDLTYMYCMEDVDLKITYPNIKKNNDLTGYETPNGNFAIDEDGNMNCNKATMTNATINNGNVFVLNGGLGSSEEPNKIVIANMENYEYDASGIGTSIYSDFSIMLNCENGSRIVMDTRDDDPEIYIGNSEANVGTSIYASGIETPILTQTSRAENKKNFELLENALKIIDDTDIYKYNLINEEDGKKKHIGLVIGEDYKYSSEVTSINKDGEEIGVDTYSMVAVCFKAIQEQQKQIKELTKIIEELKESKEI